MKPSMGERDARDRTCGVEDRDGEGAKCHSFLATHLVYRLGRCVVDTSLTPGLRKEHGPETTLSEMCWCLLWPWQNTSCRFTIFRYLHCTPLV